MNPEEKAQHLATLKEAVIKDEKAFQALYEELQAAMTRAATDGLRDGIADALNALSELPPGEFSRDDLNMIMGTLEQRVGAEAIKAAMHRPIINLSQAIFRVGFNDIGTAAGNIDVAFMQPDHLAMQAMQRGNLYWVGESWGVHTKPLLDDALIAYFDEGLTREQLAARLKENFDGIADRSESYWNLLADHTAHKTREIGRVQGYQAGGIIKYVEVRAHVDERTTDICREMHGKIIPVEQLVEQKDDYLNAIEAQDKDAAKAAWTMHRNANGLDGKTLPKGTASPPYHFRCRTITVVYFGEN